ncbi:6517_t:CDS:1, partial [Ambispora gerdemannii]
MVAAAPILEKNPTPLISVGSGSIITAAPLQVCGSAAAMGGVGVTINSPSPHTILDDCDNAN